MLKWIDPDAIKIIKFSSIAQKESFKGENCTFEFRSLVEPIAKAVKLCKSLKLEVKNFQVDTLSLYTIMRICNVSFIKSKIILEEEKLEQSSATPNFEYSFIKCQFVDD